MDRLQLSVENGAYPTVKVVGELDCTNCSEFGGLIREIVKEHGPCVSLDLDGLDFIDSSGLRTLVVTARDIRAVGGSVRVVSLTSPLNHMLEVTGFRHFFDEIAETSESPAATPALRLTGIRSFSFHVEPVMSACRNARDKICNFAAAFGADPISVDDIKLAVGEAASNAVKHGKQTGGIHVRCHAGVGKILITFRYPSARFNPDTVLPPDMDLLPEGGMGIHLMKLAMDGVHYQFDDGYTLLTLEKNIRAVSITADWDRPRSAGFSIPWRADGDFCTASSPGGSRNMPAAKTSTVPAWANPYRHS